MALKKRKYKNYQHYLDHQREKLSMKMKHFQGKFGHRVKNFIKRLAVVSPKIHGRKVLCLAARLGEEVVAFRELGHTEAVGIDLNPGPDNEYVIEGDFHDIPFGDGQFDGIYCNCLDHAWDLQKVSKECARVIKPNGLLVLDIPFVQAYKNKDYKKNIKKKNKYEALIWDTLDDVLKEFSEFSEIYERIPSDTHKITVFLQKQ
jgi:SAM-dependent methyltransferase